MKQNFIYKTANNTFEINSFITSIQNRDILCDYSRCSVFCKTGCRNFNKKYSCPPNSPSFEKISKNYEYIVVNAFQIPYEHLRSEYNTVRMANVVAKSFQRKIFDKTVIDLNNSNINFFMLENGSCRLCKICSMQKNEPCKHPDKMRFSLEATGIDVNDLLLKCFDFSLQWYYKGQKNNFPEYQTVVGAILTNKPEQIISILNKNIDTISSRNTGFAQSS